MKKGKTKKMFDNDPSLIHVKVRPTSKRAGNDFTDPLDPPVHATGRGPTRSTVQVYNRKRDMKVGGETDV